ncbi:hypothetical protein BKA63DRAFT_138826 [Paraphoma chrysanthemicola]|nr:hypothetical protein BKA63DRAFT_138826 [Paraphoma chrysanthemicola]
MSTARAKLGVHINCCQPFVRWRFPCMSPTSCVSQRLELRNRIYEYAIAIQSSAEESRLPSLPLAQVCRQLRTEFYPMCLQAPIILDWKYLPGYLATFYSGVNETSRPFKYCPSSITVLADGCLKHGVWAKVDLVHLIRMAHTRSDFSCTFAYWDVAWGSDSDSDHEAREYTDEEKSYIEDDNNMLVKVIFNQNDQWRHDVTNGTLKHIFMDYVGSAEIAEMNIVLSDNFEVSLPSVDETDEYLERVGLDQGNDHTMDVRVTRESAMCG